jgi:2-polyprenyl-3-methyl-5-hydroxy-6-metoxy-1,4-benzoquinol methylase
MQQPTSCFLCGENHFQLWASAGDGEYHSTPDQFDFYECEKCKLLQIHPIPMDKLSQIYPSNYYSFVAQKASLVNNIKEYLDGRLFRKILKNLKGDLNVLDVGGGSGWLLNTIRKIDNRVKTTQVVDIDPDAEALAKQNGHQYFCGRIEDFKTDEKFDFVLLLNLIEHVEQPLEVLKNIESVLTPQGIVLIKTPNYDSWDARLFRHRNWGGLHCPRHWVLFTQESFTKMANQANLNIKEFSLTQGAPFWAVSLLIALNKKGWITVNQEKPAYTHFLYPVFLGLFAGLDFLRRPFAKTSQMFVVLEKK